MDHVKDYKPPKDFGTEDQITQKLRSEGCAPKLPSSSEDEDNYNIPMKKVKKGIFACISLITMLSFALFS